MLDAVAVVRVDVDVGHAQPVLAQSQDGQHGVVDVAEAGGAIRKRVVQPAGEVKRALDGAARDEVRRGERARGHELRDLPQSPEDGVVAEAEPVDGAVGGIEPAVRALEDVHVLARVIARDVRFGGRLRRHDARVGQRRQPIGAHQPPGQAQTLHAQRMLAAVVEAVGFLGVNEGSLHEFIVAGSARPAWAVGGLF